MGVAVDADWLSVRLQCEAETRSSVFRRYKRPLQLRLTQGLQYFSGYTLEMRFFFFEIFLKMITGFNQTVPV